jgi:hypothetical protein
VLGELTRRRETAQVSGRDTGLEGRRDRTLDPLARTEQSPISSRVPTQSITSTLG